MDPLMKFKNHTACSRKKSSISGVADIFDGSIDDNVSEEHISNYEPGSDCSSASHFTDELLEMENRDNQCSNEDSDNDTDESENETFEAEFSNIYDLATQTALEENWSDSSVEFSTLYEEVECQDHDNFPPTTIDNFDGQANNIITSPFAADFHYRSNDKDTDSISKDIQVLSYCGPEVPEINANVKDVDSSDCNSTDDFDGLSYLNNQNFKENELKFPAVHAVEFLQLPKTEEKIIAIESDAEKEKKGIHSVMRIIFAAIRDKNYTLKSVRKIAEHVTIDSPCKPALRSLKCALAKRLEEFEARIDILERNIENKYEGPCFDSTYDTLNDQCFQFQLELDTMEVTGKIEIQQQRKQCIVRINKAAARLNNKAHLNGQLCELCKD